MKTSFVAWKKSSLIIIKNTDILMHFVVLIMEHLITFTTYTLWSVTVCPVFPQKWDQQEVLKATKWNPRFEKKSQITLGLNMSKSAK